MITITLSKDQYKELCGEIIRGGESRKDAQGKIDTADFLAGAMCTMGALGIPCPVWPIQMMCGEKLIRTDLEKVKDCKLEELPLLIGKIKDGYAKQRLESRLKEGT